MAAEKRERKNTAPAYPARPFAVQVEDPQLIYAQTRLQTGELKSGPAKLSSTELENKLFLRQFTYLLGPEAITHIISPNHESPAYGLFSVAWMAKDYVKAVTDGKNHFDELKLRRLRGLLDNQGLATHTPRITSYPDQLFHMKYKGYSFEADFRFKDPEEEKLEGISFGVSKDPKMRGIMLKLIDDNCKYSELRSWRMLTGERDFLDALNAYSEVFGRFMSSMYELEGFGVEGQAPNIYSTVDPVTAILKPINRSEILIKEPKAETKAAATTSGKTDEREKRPDLSFIPEAEIAQFPTFAEVVDQEEALFKAKSLAAQIKNPKMFESLGIEPPQTMLVGGPSGTGKSFIGEALVKETGARGIKVKCSQILDMWLGNSEKNLDFVFEEAGRKATAEKPVIIIMDEIEALAQKLMGNPTESALRLRATFLNILYHLPANVYLYGTTNHIDMMDDAYVRRFKIKTDTKLPGQEGRQSYITNYSVKRQEKAVAVAEKNGDIPQRIFSKDFDFAFIAQRTVKLSQDDLQTLLDASVTNKAVELASAQKEWEPVTVEDVLKNLAGIINIKKQAGVISSRADTLGFGSVTTRKELIPAAQGDNPFNKWHGPGTLV